MFPTVHKSLIGQDQGDALRGLKCDNLSPKSDISPQKCSLFPRKDHSTTYIIFPKLIDLEIYSLKGTLLSMLVYHYN